MRPLNFLFQRLTLTLLLAGVLGACSNKDPEQLVVSARDYLQKKDNAAAIIELKNALQEKPDLMEARMLLGQAQLDSGDLVGAEAELRKAREANYMPDAVSPLLARTWLAQGQARKVTEAFDQVRLGSPKAQAELLTWLAIAWRQQGKTENFRKRLEDALQVQPEYAPALIEHARQKAADGEFNEALTEIDQLIGREPSNAEALKLRGDVLLHGLGKREEGLAAYRASVEADPKLLEAHSALVRALLADGKTEEAEKALATLSTLAAGHPLTLYLQAQLAYQKRDLKLAKERVQQLLKRTPDNPMANEMAGVIELETGSTAQAQSFLGKALQASPGLRVARRALVLAHLRSGQVDQAIAALPQGLSPEKVDADPSMLSVAGRAYMAKGDFAQAQAFFKRASQGDPKDPGKRTSLAVSQFMSGQSDMALNELADISAQDTGTVADMALINAHMQRRDFEKALIAIGNLEKKRAQDPMPKHLRGLALMLRNDQVAARKAFEETLAVDPDYLAAVAGLATLDMADKKPEDAARRLEALTQRAPQNAQAWMALADVRQSTGTAMEKVVQAIEQAVQAAPSEARPRVMLIDQHLRNKDNKAALTAAQSAVAALPEVPEVVAALGRAQASSGEQNQAMATFNKLAALMPKSPTPYMLMAGAQATNKDPKGAIQSLSKAIEIQPDFLQAQRALAELAVQNRQVEQALSVSKTIQKQRPGQSAGFVLEGDIQAAFQAVGCRCHVAYRAKHSSLRPRSGIAAIKLHSVLVASAASEVDADRWAERMEQEQSQPKRSPSCHSYLGDLCHRSRAVTWQRRRHYERVDCFAACAMHWRSTIWRGWPESKDAPDAMCLWPRRANAAVAPDQPAFMDTLAMLLSEKGEHAKAIALQKQAIALKPEVPVFKLNLAKMLIKSGDKSGAARQLDELAALGDKFAGQAEVRGLQQSLK